MVIIPFGAQFLALEDDEFQRALSRAQELMPDRRRSKKQETPRLGNPDPTILDAAGAERATGVPASWWLDAARKRDVPHVRLGKYVRFNLEEVLKVKAQRTKE